MPIYEFTCGECEHEFEALRPMSGGGPVACPTCGSEEVARRMSQFAARSAGGSRTAPGPTVGRPGGGCGPGCGCHS